MKRIWLLCAALALVLCACGGDEPKASAAPTETAAVSARPTVLPTKSPVPAPTPTAWSTEEGTLVPSTPEQSAQPVPSEAVVLPPESETSHGDAPSDEEVLSAYREASQAVSWFAGYGAPDMDYNDVKSDGEGQPDYYRVTQKPLDNMDALRAYLKNLFSDELVDGFLMGETPTFQEFDGGLYCLSAGRGADITKGGTILSVIWPDEENPRSCTVQAVVDLLDPNASFAVIGQETDYFPYQQVGNKWVFTQFQSIF